MPRRPTVALGLIATLAAYGCSRGDDATHVSERRRRTVTVEREERAAPGDADVVYAPAHRLVQELDPPLAAALPEECSVADDFRPALGCLESLPLAEYVAPRPPDGRLTVEGSLPRRLWNRPVLIEPRVRGEPLAGFKLAPGRVLEAGFLGFDFETTLPPLAGENDLEVQIRGYVVPPAERDFLTVPISVAAGDYLSFALGTDERATPLATGPIEFRVSALAGDTERDLFTERVAPPEASGGWLDRRVDLSDLAGQTVRLRFRTRVDADGHDLAIGFPLWGSPEIFQRVARGARRNLILISLDTWRRDHFGGRMWGGPITPELEAEARSAVVFEEAIATYPSTSASHMSLLTGLYPVTHQVRFANDVLADTLPTLAEILDAHGYQTGAVTEDAMLLAESGFSFGFDSYFENKGLSLWSTEGQIDSTLARGRAWLEGHRGERFFLFLHTYQVHSPYEPPPEFVPKPSEAERAAARAREPTWVTVQRERYAGEVRYADVTLAGFLRGLDASGMLAESIVVLTSDHGEEFGEHHRMGHSKSVYDEVLRVPLIFWAPGLVRPGTRVAQQVSLIDVVPTLLDLLGIDAPPDLQGRSLRPALEGKRLPDDRPRFAEGPDVAKPGHRLVAVRTGSYKWIAPEGSDVPTQIYDLGSDPGETKNLDDPALRAAGARQLRAYSDLSHTQGAKRDLDARTTEKLKALGYVE